MPSANQPGSPEKSSSAPSREPAWLGGGIVVIAFVLSAALSWRKWPDIVIDFGSQLYLPWKISTGSVLYRDVNYLTAGPLSQYYHALLFKCFGVSFRTLIVSNLVLTAALLVLLYRKFLAAANALAATLICVAITLIFVFNQYGDIGNYNFISPYCHEVVHGVFLSIFAITFFSLWNDRERIIYAVAAGFCFGLVFLTKPEVFAALAMTVAAAFVLFAGTKRKYTFALKSVVMFTMASATPIAACLIYFHQFENWHEAARATAFAWVPILHGGVSNGPFYKWCFGLDAPEFHIISMFKQFGVIVVVTAMFVFLFRRKMDSGPERISAVATVAIVLALASRFDWTDCGRALPLLDLIFCVLLCSNYRKLSAERPVTFLLLWSIFGLFLLAKLGLFCRIWHYGFILAMPAFISAISLFVWLLPKLLKKYGVRPKPFRIAFSVVLLFGCAFLFGQSQLRYAHKTFAVGANGDKIFTAASETNAIGPDIQTALAWMEKHAPHDATLAVLPEGVMVNYLSRRTNPTRFLVWNPVELAMFGQSDMIAIFRANAPDYIMFIHRNAAEYGADYFGKKPEFGLELMQWINQTYEPVELIGNEPLQNSKFGIKILKRRTTYKS